MSYPTVCILLPDLVLYELARPSYLGEDFADCLIGLIGLIGLIAPI